MLLSRDSLRQVFPSAFMTVKARPHLSEFSAKGLIISTYNKFEGAKSTSENSIRGTKESTSTNEKIYDSGILSGVVFFNQILRTEHT